MSSIALDPSWLDNADAAREKIAEVFAVGQMTRSMRKEALSLEDVKGMGSQVVDTIRKNPAATTLAGAGIGAAVGGGSALLSKKKKPNVLGNMLTGGLAGAGIGGGAAMLSHGLPELLKSLPKGNPTEATSPLPAGVAASPDKARALLDQLDNAAAPSIGKTVHTGVNSTMDTLRRHPLIAGVLGTDAIMSGSSAVQNNASLKGKPRVSLNLDDFRRGFDQFSDKATGLLDKHKHIGLGDDHMRAMGALRDDDTGLRRALQRALGGQSTEVEIPNLLADKERSKLLAKMTKHLGDIDTRIKSHAGNASQLGPALDQYKDIYNEFSKELGSADLFDELGQMRPVFDPIRKKLDALHRNISGMPGAGDMAMDASDLRSMFGKMMDEMPSQSKKVEVPHTMFGQVSSQGRPAERWTSGGPAYGPDALARAGVTDPNKVKSTRLLFNKLLNSIRRVPGGVADAARKGDVKGVGAAVTPSEKTRNVVRQLLARRRGLLDGLGPKARLAGRAGMYATPVAGLEGLRAWRQGGQEKAKVDKLVKEIMGTK